MAKRARKAEGMKQIGEAAKSAIVGDNSQIEDDSIKAVNLGKIKRAKAALESEQGSYRNVLKQAQGKGLHLKAAIRAISITKMKDREEEVAYITALCEYLFILGMPLDRSQLEMFRGLEPRVPATERAAVQGRMAAVMGDGEGVCPYAVESKQGQAWLTAFRAGQDERTRILEMDSAVGDETLIKGEHEGESDTVDDAESDEAEIEEAGADPVHAEFDASDPGAELDPPNPDSETHAGAIH